MTTMRDAQRAYDNQSPDETPDPLEITEVVNWIDSQADRLMCGRDVMLDSATLVEASELSDLVALHAVYRYAHKNDEGNLGRLILAALDYEPAMSAAYARAIFGGERDWCKELAVELLEPFAKQILEHICAENAGDDE